MNTRIRFAATALAVTLTGLAAFSARPDRPPRRAPAEGAKLHRFSTTVEKERPTLDEETKRLISAYRRDPSDANRAALEKKVRDNYDKVIARKKAKLEELKKTARHESKIKEMEEIVREVIADKENRVARSMRRFTDPRLRPGTREDGRRAVKGGAWQTPTYDLSCFVVCCSRRGRRGHRESRNGDANRPWPEGDDYPCASQRPKKQS